MERRALGAQLCLYFVRTGVRKRGDIDGEWMRVDASARRGCFFCRTGAEKAVARRFEIAFPEGRAVIPMRERIRRTAEAVFEDSVPLLPGYLFFELPPDAGNGASLERAEAALRAFSRQDGVLRLLRYTGGDWVLHGADDRFAELFFRESGSIGLSQAYFDEGNRIRILKGFLKDYEGCIIRVNKKTRTAEICVDFQGKKVSLWLGYELVAQA